MRCWFNTFLNPRQTLSKQAGAFHLPPPPHANWRSNLKLTYAPLIDLRRHWYDTMYHTPSLGRSDDSAVDSSSVPGTPSDMSMFAQAYSIPADSLDMGALPERVGTPQPSRYHMALPDILHPETASSVPIRTICCIGAGYVGA